MKKTGYGSAYGIHTVVTTFVVQLVDPCKKCNLIAPFNNLSLYSIIGNERPTYTFLDYTDDVSLANDDPSILNYGRKLCKER